MHQRSKWVTLTLFKKGENYFLSWVPPIDALAFTKLKSAMVQGKGNGEGEIRRRHQRHSPGWQQPSLFFCVSSISLLPRSPITLEGCAALRRSQRVSSPPSTHRFVFLPCRCFAVATKLPSGKENVFPFSLKAIWLGGCPRSTARWMHAMSIINCFHLPFRYSRWMSMY